MLNIFVIMIYFGAKSRNFENVAALEQHNSGAVFLGGKKTYNNILLEISNNNLLKSYIIYKYTQIQVRKFALTTYSVCLKLIRTSMS